jgi:putative FmdB family regulatory protein
VPTYAFACPSCGHRFEEVISIHDSAVPACPECGSEVRKVFGNVGVSFKGSGFYRTDSRATPSKASSAGSTTSTSTGTSAGSTSSSSSD